MPTEDFKQSVAGRRVDLRALAASKPEWKVPMDSLVFAAERAGALNKTPSHYIWKQFNIHKIMLHEPPELDSPAEQPRTVSDLVHINNMGYTLADLSKMNYIYDWCRNDRRAALSYVAGLYDSAAHAAAVIDSGRHVGKDSTSNDVEIDFALNRVVGYCKPDRATLEQVTDVFCTYLKDNPSKRDGLPAIIFPDALKKTWHCPGR